MKRIYRSTAIIELESEISEITLRPVSLVVRPLGVELIWESVDIYRVPKLDGWDLQNEIVKRWSWQTYRPMPFCMAFLRNRDGAAEFDILEMSLNFGVFFTIHVIPMKRKR